MSTLVTGGCGFLGRHLVSHLLETSGDHIVVLDADTRCTFDDPGSGTTLVAGDVLDLRLLIDIVNRWSVSKIAHLAFVLESASHDIRGQIEANVMGTTNVFEAARRSGIYRVVYTSSAYVYPHRQTLDGHRYSEDDPVAPDGVYGACKVINERIAQQYAELYGLDPIGLRFTAVFGPGRGERTGIAPDDLNVLPELALRGQRVVMPPDDQLSDWMYVADAVEVVRLALNAEPRGHRVFNVASDCRPVGEIVQIVRGLLPGADVVSGDIPFITTSLMRTDRLRRELAFTPKYTVEEGMAAYLESVRSCVR